MQGALPASIWWHLSLEAPGKASCPCSVRDRCRWCRQLNTGHAACAGFWGASHIAAPSVPSSSQEALSPPGQQWFQRDLHLLDPGRVMSPVRERHRQMPVSDPLDAGSPKLMLPLLLSAPVLQNMGTCLFRAMLIRKGVYKDAADREQPFSFYVSKPGIKDMWILLDDGGMTARLQESDTYPASNCI